MLTRREFLKQAGVLVTGAVAAASGIAAIVPRLTNIHTIAGGRRSFMIFDNLGINIRLPDPDVWEYTAHAVDDFIDAVEHQSLMRLDNVGICLRQSDLDRAYRNYALSLGKTDWQMTDNERRAAFVTAALERNDPSLSLNLPDVRYCPTMRGYWGGKETA